MNPKLLVLSRRALSSCGFVFFFAVACSPTALQNPPAASLPPVAELEPVLEQEECPIHQVRACDAYLQTAATCFKLATPERRMKLSGDLAIRCKDLMAVTSDVKRWNDCEGAILSLLDESACRIQATTALSSLVPPREPWCKSNASPAIESDPIGPVQIILKSEMSSLLSVQAVAVAVDGVGVLVHNVPDDKTDVGGGGVLGTFRGRLSPGEHDVRLFVQLRTASNAFGSVSKSPVHLVLDESCVTISNGVMLTAAVILVDGQRDSQSQVGVRFDVR